MNKQELSEKWSKYCNTDKLVDDTIQLLREYRHCCTEHGVCTLLDTYFTQKEPLIKLFITSKHYIGDMRIALAKEFDREIDSDEVYLFFADISSKLHLSEMIEYTDEKGKKMFDYLPAGKTVFDIADLPNAEEQEKKTLDMRKFRYDNGATKLSYDNIKTVQNYMNYFRTITKPSMPSDYQINAKSPLLKAGTKTSRAFNKVCTHYGVDKLHPEVVTVNENGTAVEKTVYPYNKVFAEYADLVSSLKRKMQFIISLNPLDYLTMSNGVNWHSCHNISSGGYMGGTISYMLDTTSMITFVVNQIDDDIHKIPKVYRQMYHYENNLFIQSRLYPQGNDGATNLYNQFRGYVIKEFSDLLGVDGEWTCKVSRDECDKHAISMGAHYPDYRFNNDASIFYPTNSESSIENLVMIIGHKGICVKCGKEYDYRGRLTHKYTTECGNILEV